MKKAWLIVLLAALLALLCLTGCETTAARPDASEVIDASGFPVEYGRLVSVTTMSEYPDWFQLWFEDEQGTVRVVRYNLPAGVVLEDVKLFPRL